MKIEHRFSFFKISIKKIIIKKLNTDFHFLRLEKYENWKSMANFYFLFLKLKKKKWKLNTDYQFLIFQLSEKMNDPNIHALSEPRLKMA